MTIPHRIIDTRKGQVNISHEKKEASQLRRHTIHAISAVVKDKLV